MVKINQMHGARNDTLIDLSMLDVGGGLQIGRHFRRESPERREETLETRSKCRGRDAPLVPPKVKDLQSEVSQIPEQLISRVVQHGCGVPIFRLEKLLIGTHPQDV
jgi:hypothetical protein